MLQGVIESRLANRGYIHTLYGRHLHPESPHKAINALIQGCAADIMRHALIRVHAGLEPYKAHMVSVIHDEIIIDAPMDEVPELTQLVPTWMDCARVSETVPIYVDVEWSTTNWAEKSAYEEANV